MRTDTRLSRMLHVLLHMARHQTPFTSEQIADMLGTNPVVVRRTMGGLREAGYVRAEKGRGGGWTMAGAPAEITLLDIHRAVASPNMLFLGCGNPDAACGVERVVSQALDDTLREAEELLLRRLGQVSLADLAARFDAICIAEGWDRRGAHPS